MWDAVRFLNTGNAIRPVYMDSCVWHVTYVSLSNSRWSSFRAEWHRVILHIIYSTKFAYNYYSVFIWYEVPHVWHRSPDAVGWTKFIYFYIPMLLLYIYIYIYNKICMQTEKIYIMRTKTNYNHISFLWSPTQL